MQLKEKTPLRAVSSVGVGATISVVVNIWVGFRNSDIVGRIAVIRDECATFIIAGKLDLGWVNGIDGSVMGLSVNLKDDVIVILGSGGKLGVGAIGNCDASTDLVKGHTVGAERGSDVGILGLIVMMVSTVGVVMDRWIMGVNGNVVGRIAIIGDECATFIIAGKLDKIGVDVCDGSVMGSSVNLKDDVILIQGSGGKLGVGAGGNFNVSSACFVENNIMGVVASCGVVGVVVVGGRGSSVTVRVVDGVSVLNIVRVRGRYAIHIVSVLNTVSVGYRVRAIIMMIIMVLMVEVSVVIEFVRVGALITIALG